MIRQLQPFEYEKAATPKEADDFKGELRSLE